jgi:hypothetical protein
VTSFRREQLIGIAGALPAFVVVALTLDHASTLFAFIESPSDSRGNKNRGVAVLGCAPIIDGAVASVAASTPDPRGGVTITFK